MRTGKRSAVSDPQSVLSKRDFSVDYFNLLDEFLGSRTICSISISTVYNNFPSNF